MIFDGKKILIYDYKTDDIEKKEIKKHAEYYLMQLKFYLYIASKLFREFDLFEGSLVFVKHPDDVVTLSYDKVKIKKKKKIFLKIFPLFPQIWGTCAWNKNFFQAYSC